MLPENIVLKIRDELEHCSNPLFFFHDDPDGSASYIQMYRYKQEGKGNMVKMIPKITVDHLKWIEQFGSDKVFVFDIAMIDQEFLDACPVPVVWLDHHDIQECDKVLYVNARNYGEMTPPSVMCYQVCEKDLWLACVGAIGDWYWTPLLYDLQKQYPDLLEIDLDSVKDLPEEVLFNTKLGVLIDVLSFNLKGISREALQSMKVFTRIEDPHEILEQSTSQGKYLWKKYLNVKQSYDKEKEKAMKSYDSNDPLFVHTYTTTTFSVTKDLANELSYRHQDKVIVLARERGGQKVMSLRSSREGPVINEALEKALAQCPGSHGGGHEHACGAAVNVEDFDTFLQALRDELGL